MSTLSTHVLDAERGVPAVGMVVGLADAEGHEVERTITDDDGRARFTTEVEGVHVLLFATGEWYAEAGRSSFLPAVHVVFAVDPARPHHHVPLLLSPYSYTTYRGS